MTAKRHDRADVIGRELGIITLGNLVRVTDPCYNRDMGHGGKAVLDILPGRWIVEMDVLRSTGDPWNLAIMHEDFIGKYTSLRFHPYHVNINVDSGSVGFFDDHYHAQIEHGTPAFDTFYDECGVYTLGEKRGGIIKGGWGAVSGTCYGDGEYCLLTAHARRDRTGPVVSAFVNYAYGDTE